jgi:hypothetical protein
VDVFDRDVVEDCGGAARQAEARLAAHSKALDRSLRQVVGRIFCFGAIRGTMEVRG